MTLSPDASNKVCNFFDLRSTDEKHAKTWEKLKPEVEEKTKQGYKNLEEILKKAKLL
jgi:hypothetical protein